MYIEAYVFIYIRVPAYIHYTVCIYLLICSVQYMQASAYDCTVYTVPAFVYKPIFFLQANVFICVVTYVRA